MEQDDQELLNQAIEEGENLRSTLKGLLEYLAKTPVDEMSSADREELRNTLEQIRMIEHFLEEIKSRRTH